jgi:hypothetical protein
LVPSRAAPARRTQAHFVLRRRPFSSDEATGQPGLGHPEVEQLRYVVDSDHWVFGKWTRQVTDLQALGDDRNDDLSKCP